MRIAKCESKRLLELFDLADDGVEIRPVTGIEFGMEQFAIGANFKGAAARRDEGERFDAFAEFKNFGRQTDGLRRVVSNYTVFDRDFHLHPVRSFPVKMVRKPGETVKVPEKEEAAATDCAAALLTHSNYALKRLDIQNITNL